MRGSWFLSKMFSVSLPFGLKELPELLQDSVVCWELMVSQPVLKLVCHLLLKSALGRKEGVAGADVGEDGRGFWQLKGFQAGHDVSLVLLSTWMIFEELLASARLQLPTLAKVCNLPLVVPKNFAQGLVRHLLDGLGG